MVLNGKGSQHRISEAMVKRVFAVAEEMNYSPNLIAQNLRSGKSQLIGVIVTDISNPFYATISRIIEDRASELNYTVLFSSSDEDLSKTKKFIKILINKGVAGLIVVPCDGAEAAIKKLHTENVPLVLVDRHFPKLDINHTCLNNYKATELVTQHLIDQGYRHIAVISYKTEMSHINDRLAGYKSTMAKAGLSQNVNIQRVDLANPKKEMPGVFEELLRQKADSVICLTNLLSIRAIYTLNEMKIKIPQELAFVGFNRNDVFNLLQSKITYIKQPIEEIAHQATEILIDRISNSGKTKKINFVAEPELVIQGSTPKKNSL